MDFSVYSATEKWFRTKKIPCAATKTVASTNDLAKEEAFKIKEPLKVYLADQQTKGRGRGANTWANSEPGGALMLTYSFFLNHAPQPITTPLIGLSLFEALNECFGSGVFSIKPPNDIYLGTKKILGVLVEAVQQDKAHRLVVGIGLNVFSHPDNIAVAGHLSSVKTITPQHWEDFLHLLHTGLNRILGDVANAHLTEPQRQQLLQALNLYPPQKQKYISVSPFGDLSTADAVISWRDL